MNREVNRGRALAQRLYELDVCEYVDCEKDAVDRHHIDGDPTNNAPDNISRLCRRHHMVVDGRLEKSRELMRRQPPQPSKGVICTNCERTWIPLSSGLCPACRVYLKRHGVPRPSPPPRGSYAKRTT